MTLFLGIDIGTSAVKALVVDENERLVAETEVPLALSRPKPGWAEQDPETWWLATFRAVSGIRANIGARIQEVAAIGLSGQMHGAVLLGADGHPLMPAILWNDGRSAGECAELNAGVPGLADVTGVPAMPGFLLPKLLWLQRHRPEIHAAIDRIVLPKDYVRLRLTGAYATDMCDAAGALLLDEARRDWWQPALDAVGLQRHHLPELLEGTAISGTISDTAAAMFGLPAGTPVAAGGGDAAAGAVGIGSVNDGDSFISLGTSAQVFVTTARYAPNPGALVHAFAHALPGRWFQMGAMLNGASALAWMAQAMQADIAALLAEVTATPKPVSPVTFLPYLQGERTPHDDADARGVLFGMDGGAGRADLAQAVLEGVAFTMLDAQNALAAAGTRAESYAFIGGGARSRLWAEIIASALDRPLHLLRGGAKGPAFGAARLARIALTGEDVASVCRRPEAEVEILPDPRRRDALAERHPLFRQLYQALRPVFRDAGASKGG